MDNNETNREAYRAAFTEASSELKELFGKLEQLDTRRTHVEKAVEVLGRKIGITPIAISHQVRRKTLFPGLTVVTCLTAFETVPGSEK